MESQFFMNPVKKDRIPLFFPWENSADDYFCKTIHANKGRSVQKANDGVFHVKFVLFHYRLLLQRDYNLI